MDDKIKDHIKKLKEHEPDLYEEMEPEEVVEIFENAPVSKKKRPPSKNNKIVIVMISVFMVASVVGSLGAVINIPAIQFLQKSYELSQLDFIQQYKEAVVTVKVENSKGTGFNISEDGFIITNEHVVEDSEHAFISFEDGRAFQAKVIKTFPEFDIAFLQVDSEDALPFLTLAEGKNWSVGDHVHFVGNPLTFNRIANEGQLAGETAMTRLNIPVMMIQAPIYKGNSGSPVIDEEGNVIAVIYATNKLEINGNKEKVGLAIPVPHFIEQISR